MWSEDWYELVVFPYVSHSNYLPCWENNSFHLSKLKQTSLTSKVLLAAFHSGIMLPFLYRLSWYIVSSWFGLIFQIDQESDAGNMNQIRSRDLWPWIEENTGRIKLPHLPLVISFIYHGKWSYLEKNLGSVCSQSAVRKMARKTLAFPK